MSLLLIFFLHFSIKTRNQKKRNQPWMFGLQQGGRGLAPERMLGLTSSRGACWEKLERHTCAYLCMRDAAVAAFEGWAGWKRKTWWTEWKEEPKSPAEIKYSKSSQRGRGPQIWRTSKTAPWLPHHSRIEHKRSQPKQLLGEKTEPTVTEPRTYGLAASVLADILPR